MEGFRGLKVYQLAYALARDVFIATRPFPKTERFALTDQLRRSSRSIAANIAEGYRKKRCPRAYLLKLIDADGELAETFVWLDFAYDFGYLTAEQHVDTVRRYEEVGRMLNGLITSIESTVV